MRKLREGTRVEYTGSPVLGPSYGSRGSVAMVAGARGRSTSPDPCGLMTFVAWDNGRPEGVYTRNLKRLTAADEQQCPYCRRYDCQAKPCSTELQRRSGSATQSTP